METLQIELLKSGFSGDEGERFDVVNIDDDKNVYFYDANDRLSYFLAEEQGLWYKLLEPGEGVLSSI